MTPQPVGDKEDSGADLLTPTNHPTARWASSASTFWGEQSLSTHSQPPFHLHHSLLHTCLLKFLLLNLSLKCVNRVLVNKVPSWCPQVQQAPSPITISGSGTASLAKSEQLAITCISLVCSCSSFLNLSRCQMDYGSGPSTITPGTHMSCGLGPSVDDLELTANLAIINLVMACLYASTPHALWVWSIS